MRRIRSLAAAALAVMAVMPMSADIHVPNPMTRAVIEAYSRQIEADPSDHEALMGRAGEMLGLGEYEAAVADIDAALAVIPGKRADLREQAYTMRAMARRGLGQLAEALADLNSAVTVAPQSLSAIMQRAEVETELGMLREAKLDYKRLQRVNPRSVDALFGLARVSFEENNLGLAREYLDNAVAMSSNSAESLVRRAEILSSTGNHGEAVDDLLAAIGLEGGGQALNSLLALSDSHYDAVRAGLTRAAEQTESADVFRYLRAVVAERHHRYLDSVNDYRYIAGSGAVTPGIHASLARGELALGRYKDAIENIDAAIQADPSDAGFYLLKSRVCRAFGQPDIADEAASVALTFDRGNVEALVESALSKVALGKKDEATGLLSEALLTNPSDADVLLLKAWTLGDDAGRAADVRALLSAVDAPGERRAFALLGLGRDEEAVAEMEAVLADGNDSDGRLSYLGACFFARKGDNDRALALAEKSLSLGYGSYYDWQAAGEGFVTVAPLRNDARFKQLMDKWSHLFTGK